MASDHQADGHAPSDGATPKGSVSANAGSQRASEATQLTQHYDVETAAAKLGISPAALRARCRREAERTAEAIISLGGGITAFKFGRTWRFTFPTRS